MLLIEVLYDESPWNDPTDRRMTVRRPSDGRALDRSAAIDGIGRTALIGPCHVDPSTPMPDPRHPPRSSAPRPRAPPGPRTRPGTRGLHGRAILGQRAHARSGPCTVPGEFQALAIPGTIAPSAMRALRWARGTGPETGLRISSKAGTKVLVVRDDTAIGNDLSTTMDRRSTNSGWAGGATREGPPCPGASPQRYPHGP